MRVGTSLDADDADLTGDDADLMSLSHGERGEMLILMLMIVIEGRDHLDADHADHTGF